MKIVRSNIIKKKYFSGNTTPICEKQRKISLLSTKLDSEESADNFDITTEEKKSQKLILKLMGSYSSGYNGVEKFEDPKNKAGKRKHSS